MVEIVFLGVGEAFDENLPNTSVLVKAKNGGSNATLLLDCGFTAPPQFWEEGMHVDALDAVWISHFHGDHFFGVPALLVRFMEEGRRKEITFLGQKGIDDFIRKSLDLAYPNFLKKLPFTLNFLEIEPGTDAKFLDINLRTAESSHPQRDLALRVDWHDHSIYYSGDGSPTSESIVLAEGCELIIQEAFELEHNIFGHGNVTGSIDLAKRCKSPNLALVHINREKRKNLTNNLNKYKMMAGGVNIFVPEPGDKIAL